MDPEDTVYNTEQGTADPAGSDALRSRTARWKREHRETSQELARLLASPGAVQAERSLCDLAAHDVALLEQMNDAELALVKHVTMLVEAGKPQSVPLLTRVLKDLADIRSESARRVAELLKAADALAARRRLESENSARKRHLRSVG